MIAAKPPERALVQGDFGYWLREDDPRKDSAHVPGTIAWSEHLEAFAEYANRHGTSQSAERTNDRGGFSYKELVMFLGHTPKTWEPR
jgi:hypothetical protein